MTFVWKPVVTADRIDNHATYEYGASCVNGRVFCCVGLGTDTLCSVRVSGVAPSKPFTIPGKLTADPAAVATSMGYDLYFTVGEPDGTRNGISMVRCNGSGNVPAGRVVHTIIPQTLGRPDSYGTGQPTVAVFSPGVRILAARHDRPGGGDEIRLFRMASPIQLGTEVRFNEVEDGASPEIFFYGGKLHMLIAGGGWIGVRSYDWNPLTPGPARREREKERVYDGHFRARNAVYAGDSIDGVGIVRGKTNQPVITNGSIAFWRAAGKHADPATWGLRRMTISLPPV